MYYVAGVGWRHRDLPRYNIQYATSRDGLHWHRDGTVAIDFASDEENALARPFVLKEDGRYRMWFAHEGEAYRLGYAESDDGIRRQRDDRSEEHTSELQSQMRNASAVLCLKKKNITTQN